MTSTIPFRPLLHLRLLPKLPGLIGCRSPKGTVQSTKRARPSVSLTRHEGRVVEAELTALTQGRNILEIDHSEGPLGTKCPLCDHYTRNKNSHCLGFKGQRFVLVQLEDYITSALAQGTQ
ncbi:hypothetical protein E2542_SST00476 [Spatholobus suberectus]|nr:hypothetical protein E2542_SST00476 [Spatholobus suberectus]